MWEESGGEEQICRRGLTRSRLRLVGTNACLPFVQNNLTTSLKLAKNV